MELTTLVTYRENNRLEAKEAQGGLSRSLWETYSAFANTDGGIILLGVKELSDHSLMASGIPDAEKLKKAFWDGANNRKIVSANLLTNDDVSTELLDGQTVIAIRVPRASFLQRPVYLGDNPFTGSFRRNGEGDYRCSENEVRAMIRDSAPQEHAAALTAFGMDSLCTETIASYRQRLSSLRPEHPWNNLPNSDLLLRLEAAGIAEDGSLHPTQQGLLMFGWDWQITREFPFYFLDYREILSGRRWDDRVTSGTGEWSGNVFDFWTTVSRKLTTDLPRPFEMVGITRIDDTPMHKALREALANALIHADYHGDTSVTVLRYDDRADLANPGASLLSPAEALAGGLSRTRNPALMKMFNLVGAGERAGSGFDTMRLGCTWAGVAGPRFEERHSPDRTLLNIDLPKTLPEMLDDRASLASAARSAIADPIEAVTQLSRSGAFSRAEFAKLLNIGRSSATNILSSLMEQGVLERIGSGPATSYRLVTQQ